MDSRAQIARRLEHGETPAADGWRGLYRIFDAVAPPHSQLRRAVCRYFRPSAIEIADGGAIFRRLRADRFGRYLPTGGVEIRRRTGARMRPYTLAGTSLRQARDFYYRTCVFEALHLPFFVALIALAGHRLSIGRADYALQETVMNLLVNLYPMLHHRHTRTRILQLLVKASRRRTRIVSKV